MENDNSNCGSCKNDNEIKELCNSCDVSLPNRSGLCSVRCRTGNGCDGTCHQERYRREYQEKMKKLSESEQ